MIAKSLCFFLHHFDMSDVRNNKVILSDLATYVSSQKRLSNINYHLNIVNSPKDIVNMIGN